MGAPDVLCVSVDVTDAAAVQRACEPALIKFSAIDVWINNAGVAVIGSFTDVPLLHDKSKS